MRLRRGDAQALQFEDGSFCAVVFTFALCAIPDDGAAVREGVRVLRPGGRLVAAEHVRSPVWPVRVGQRLLEPAMVRLEGDHLLREPLDHVWAQGLEIAELERSSPRIAERLCARKPPAG